MSNHADFCPAGDDARHGCSCATSGPLPPLPESAYPPGALELIAVFVDQMKHRYSAQADPNLLLCRDCGSLVKEGWISVHDGMHAAIGYPDYTTYGDEALDA